ncbi:MAG: CopG family transcriptional regulator [Desulfamplus sp.]|nr:CopG family transcriptional regulator [Desulfamplus sp.]
MLSVTLPKDIDARLDLLAAQTNKSKTFYTVEALKLYLEDLEDLYLAEKAHEEFILSGGKALSTKEVEKALGL